MSNEYLWVEKYRPKTIDDTILPKKLKETFQKIIEGGELPNMLFTGTAGLGKTTVAKALCNSLNCDYILINGSEEGNIDTLRTKIKQFASSVSLSGDYKVVILDGLHHDVDSSVLAFELASRQCFKEACSRGTLKLLEPVMRVEVVTPEDYMGDVIGDLNSRRGQISTQEQRGNATVITAMVPLANMFGYINALRSMSQGRAQYSMFFDHYDKVPQNVQDEVTKKTGS